MQVSIGVWGYDVNSVCLYREPGTLIETELVRRRQRDGKSLWAITRLSMCLNRDGEWEHEPIPSSRDDAFMERCRFQTPAVAVSVWMKAESVVR